jgi:glycosyltransferase involved in cell wall biosynthesis
MIVHLFNCGQVSGPEVLVGSNLAGLPEITVVNLEESRHAQAPTSLRTYCEQRGLKYHGITVRSRIDKRALDDLRKCLKDLTPALVHAHDVKASFYLSQIMDGSFKTVTTHHGIFGRPGLKTKAFELFYRFWILRKFDKVCAVSRQDYETLLKVPGLQGKLLFHLNGITAPHWPASENEVRRREIRDRWRVSNETFCVGLVARLSKEKNQAAALKAFESFSPADDIKLLLFGSGPEEESLRRASLQADLGSSVLFMGYCSDMQLHYAGLDAVVLLSQAEGLPMTLLEAGWAGIPVVSTSVGGIPELLQNGKCGWLLKTGSDVSKEFSETLRAMKSNPLEHRKRADLLRAFVESQYSGERWRKDLEKIYRSLGVTL